MSLVVEQLWEDMRISGGLSNDRDSESQFLRALNACISDMNTRLREDLDEVLAIPSSSIDCEDYQVNAVYAGTKAYLQRQGAWAQDPDAEAFGIFRKELGMAMSGSIAANSAFKTRTQSA